MYPSPKSGGIGRFSPPFFRTKSEVFPDFLTKIKKNGAERKKVFEKVVLLHPTETKRYGG